MKSRIRTSFNVITLSLFAVCSAYGQIDRAEHKVKHTGQDITTYSVDKKYDLMIFNQKLLYASPVSKEVIYIELMPSVKSERAALAPHFPSRGATDTDSETKVKTWIGTYPGEYESYLRLLEKKISLYNPTKAIN